MVFGFSVGSEGKGSEYLSLYMPFTTSYATHIFSSIEKFKKYRVTDYDLEVGKLENLYFLKISPFKTIEEAHNFFPKIKSSLLWVSLKENIGISFPFSIQNEVEIFKKPIKISDKSDFSDVFEEVGWKVVEGDYPADKAAVIPEKNKLMRTEFGNPMIFTTKKVDQLVECIEESLEFPFPENIFIKEKLLLAIELYSSHFYEKKNNVKFIQLVTVLEALIPDSEVSDVTKTVIASLHRTVKNERNEYLRETEEWQDLEHLLSRVSELKRQAIGKGIQIYISKIIAENPELGDSQEISNKLKKIYKTRSDLLHQGNFDSGAGEGLEFLEDFIPKLLETLYKTATTHDIDCRSNMFS